MRPTASAGYYGGKLDLGLMRFTEGLGYLGVGVPPPAATWGAMISDGQPYFTSFPYLVIVPGLAIAVSVLAFNLFGQGLQEVIEPR